jgi:hypothetical protein
MSSPAADSLPPSNPEGKTWNHTFRNTAQEILQARARHELPQIRCSWETLWWPQELTQEVVGSGGIYKAPKIWARDYQCRREHHKINRSSNKRLGEVRKANSCISFTSSSSDINDRGHFEQRQDILLNKLREKQCLDILSFYAGPHLAARQW